MTITGVVGMERELGATTPQTLGQRNTSSRWSDGGTSTHRIATPAAATTYTARFTVVTNRMPTVALTAPSSGASIAANTTTTLTATAADGDGTVSKVGFYDGTTLISEDQSSPYAAAWTPRTAGAHALTARATDNLGGTATSAVVNVTVTGGTNRSPTVAITAPANGASLPLNNVVTITATASDPDGSVQRVRFYDGATQLADDAVAPWSTSGLRRAAVPPADRRRGRQPQRVDHLAPVSITVAASGSDTQAPTLTLTSPAAQAQGITGSPRSPSPPPTTSGSRRWTTRWMARSRPGNVATLSFASRHIGLYHGVHVVRAQARDAAGNRSGWASARVTLAAAPTSRRDSAGGLRESPDRQGTAMAWSPDGRLFICEQGGDLRVVKNAPCSARHLSP